MKPARARQMLADAGNEIVGLCQSGGAVNWILELSPDRVLDGKFNPSVFVTNVKNGSQSFSKVWFRHFHPQGMNVRAHQIAVAKVDPGRHDGACAHPLGLVEIILIVWAPTSAVGVDQCGLAASTRTATPLSVVRWGRWNIP